MSRSTLLLGAWLWAALALAPLLYLALASPHGGVGVPLTPGGLNHALTQWAASLGNNLANQIGGG